MIVARPAGDLSELVDAEVRITGVPEERRDSEGWVAAEELWVPSADNLEVVKARPERSPLDTTPDTLRRGPEQARPPGSSARTNRGLIPRFAPH